MSITTKTGDDGTTRLLSGERVSKASPRLNALGDLDELVSALGVARAQPSLPSGLSAGILSLQRDLFIVGAALASRGGAVAVRESLPAPLDARCDALEAEVGAPKDFILPGENPAGAYLDLARAIARRLERRVAGLSAEDAPSRTLQAWLNRLSDLLWLMARAAEVRSRPLRSAP